MLHDDMQDGVPYLGKCLLHMCYIWVSVCCICAIWTANPVIELIRVTHPHCSDAAPQISNMQSGIVVL